MTEATASDAVRVRRTRRRLILSVIVLLPIAAHAVWDQVEATLLARDIAAVARRGEPVSITARRQPLPAGELRRSAALYAAAADLARWQTETYGSVFASQDVADHATGAVLDAAKLTAFLAESEPALQLLKAATPLDFKEFSYYAPELYTNESALQALNTMNCLSADVLSVRGEGDLAVEALVRSVRLHRTMPIPFYRAFAIRRLYGSLRILLAHARPGGESLRRLQLALEEWPDDDGMVTEIQRRRAEFLTAYWPHPADRVSWALRPVPPVRTSWMGAIAFVVFRPIIAHELRGQLDPFQEALVVARDASSRKADSARALEQRYREPPRISWFGRFAGVPPPIGTYALADLGRASFRGNVARRRTAIIAVAVERYRREHGGELPASLQALVPAYLQAVPEDPFSGEPLILKTDPAGYIVYSVDVDRRDDGGILYGHGTGTKERSVNESYATPHDIGIRVPLKLP